MPNRTGAVPSPVEMFYSRAGGRPSPAPGEEHAMNDVETGPPRSFDITEILKVLPHRYPFLLVDRIVELSDDKIAAIKNVTINEPFFVGHFPGQPIMPGVLLIEGMAQTAGAFCIRARAKAGSGPPPLVYFMTIDKAKFRKPVVPGDRVEYHVERTNQRRNIWWFKARGLVDGQCVCEAEFSALLTDTAI